MSDDKPGLAAPEMAKAVAIDHVVLKVSDVSRSESFYARYLGAQAEMREKFLRGERGFLSMRIGQALIDLVPAEDPGSVGPKGVAHICLVVEGGDPEEVRDALEREGVLVESVVNFDRLGSRGVGPSLYITDPDGYRIELKWYR
jgi:catechol 2,3-dioxygenase-like lactoylglutathione lyase family enzyme